MKLDMLLECSRIEEVSPYTGYKMHVTLEDVDLSELVSSYKSDILDELEVEDLIAAITEEGYTVTEEEV